MKSRTAWILLIFVFFIAGAAGSYLFLKHFSTSASVSVHDESLFQPSDSRDVRVVRLLLPKDGRLELVEKKLKNREKSIAFAEAVVEEFFSSAGGGYALPQSVKVLGIYRDVNQMLYVDLSDDLRRNFQGDALDEYLILKGIYESLVSNIQDFQDLKLLVEGKEIETLGGHLFLKYPLKGIVLPEPKTEALPSHD